MKRAFYAVYRHALAAGGSSVRAALAMQRLKLKKQIALPATAKKLARRLNFLGSEKRWLKLKKFLIWSMLSILVVHVVFIELFYSESSYKKHSISLAVKMNVQEAVAATVNFTVTKVPFNPRSFDVIKEDYPARKLASKSCRRYKCFKGKNEEQNFNWSDESNMTIVTAYFKLGWFQKGEQMNFTQHLYYYWLKSYELLMNDVIAFTDDTNFAQMLEVRRSLRASQRTCLCVLFRSVLWPFRLVPLISDVLSQSGYPKHHPNTIIPEYGAAMHAKYAVMQMALDWNPFKTPNFAWMDVGIFRDLVNCTDSNWLTEPMLLRRNTTTHEPFYMDLPPKWDRTRVAVNQVREAEYNVSVHTFFVENMFWVGGGFFLATREVMYRWIEQYRRTLFALLAMGLSDTDQQVLYAMFHPSILNDSRVHPNTSAIVYTQNYRKRESEKISTWFFLPYFCRHNWYTRTHGITCSETLLFMQDCDLLSNNSTNSSMELTRA